MENPGFPQSRWSWVYTGLGAARRSGSPPVDPVPARVCSLPIRLNEAKAAAGAGKQAQHGEAGRRPAVYLLCACCLREMASLVLRVDVRVYTCSKTRNGCWPWPEGVTLAPPKSTWEQPHPGRSRDLKTWVLEMKPGNCTKPGFSTRFSMLRMDPKSPDSGRA